MNDRIQELTKDLKYYSNENKILKEQNIGLKEKNVNLRTEILDLKTEILELKKQFNPHEDTFRRKLANCAIKNNQLNTQIHELKRAGRKAIEIARFVDEFQILDLEPLFTEDS